LNTPVLIRPVIEVVPSYGEHDPALMTVLDRSFTITAPLESPCDTGTSDRLR
jgi:hypothetical protein